MTDIFATDQPFEPCPSAMAVLIEAFGVAFKNASLEQLFVLMEVVPSVTLSMGEASIGSAATDLVPTVSMPDSLRKHRKLSLHETFTLQRTISVALMTLLADGDVDLSGIRSIVGKLNGNCPHCVEYFKP